MKEEQTIGPQKILPFTTTNKTRPAMICSTWLYAQHSSGRSGPKYFTPPMLRRPSECKIKEPKEHDPAWPHHSGHLTRGSMPCLRTHWCGYVALIGATCQNLIGLWNWYGCWHHHYYLGCHVVLTDWFAETAMSLAPAMLSTIIITHEDLRHYAEEFHRVIETLNVHTFRCYAEDLILCQYTRYGLTNNREA